jgi:hypothetical protein
MKNQKAMDVNKNILIMFMFYSIFSFSQKKLDVYFVLNDDNSEYVINSIMFNEKIIFINLLNKKEYQHYQKKVREAKEKGTYDFDLESGRDNIEINVSKLTFEIISREEKLLSKCEIEKLNLVDYNWILNNSWKKIANQPYDFKNIYFLDEIKSGNYKKYKVGVTIVAH